MKNNVERIISNYERKSLENNLKYKLADVGFYIGIIAALIYAAGTSNGEGLNYMKNFSKQLVSEPIIPLCVGGGYLVGQLFDLKQK